MLSGAVMQTSCGHPDIFLVAKIACGLLDNFVPLADSWCRASFALALFVWSGIGASSEIFDCFASWVNETSRNIMSGKCSSNLVVKLV